MKGSKTPRPLQTLSVAIGLTLAGVAYLAFGPAQAGDAPDSANSPDSFSTARQISGELENAIAGFDGSLPPDYKLYLKLTESRLAAAASGGENQMFEKGFAESLVVDIWRCSWEGEFLSAMSSGDEKGVAAAGQQLKGLYDLNYAKIYYEDPAHEWSAAVLEPALSGSTEPMAADFKGCTERAR